MDPNTLAVLENIGNKLIIEKKNWLKKKVTIQQDIRHVLPPRFQGVAIGRQVGDQLGAGYEGGLGGGGAMAQVGGHVGHQGEEQRVQALLVLATGIQKKFWEKKLIEKKKLIETKKF